MDNIFNKIFYFTQNLENGIVLFDRIEEFEIFQMRMGLENLCQNTLVYPVGRHSNGQLHYEIHTSPHSKNFYNSKCLKFCKDPGNSSLCNQMMHQIATYFCESRTIESLKVPDIGVYTYDEKYPQKKYICYQCPFVNLYKCAFPIYVENTVVAVLFTGQFPIGTPAKKFLLAKMNYSVLDGTPFMTLYRLFNNKKTLIKFVKDSLMPVVLSLTQKAQENLLKKQEQILQKIIEKQLFYMEEEITTFLVDLSNTYTLENPGNNIFSSFWDIISKSLSPYLEAIGAETVYIFINESATMKLNSKIMYGVQLYPDVKYENKIIFNFCSISVDENEKIKYTRNDAGDSINSILFSYITNREDYFPDKQCDMVVHGGQLCPFAIIINYGSTAIISNKGVLQRKVLEHLESFFSKVSQELIHLATLQYEQINKSVLRIYRHEIIHQLQVLKHNNLFLDSKKLRETDENKLRRVAEDQRQCIHELTFITRNINVFTGKVSKESANIDKDQLIDINGNIINKAISLYQRPKRDKTLWFLVQNKSIDNIIKSNQSLLDMIFFNLMSNAIKYAYPGTKIIIGVDDTGNYSRPHKISLTDFGSPVEADYHNQIFQMYFRGNNISAQIEGSGIGLYVANEVANILDAKLTWKSEKISDYNIPLLMRYLQISHRIQDFPPNILHLAHDEFQRLYQNILINQIVNEEYLKDPDTWNQIEIKEELTTPTYKVTFMIEL